MKGFVSQDIFNQIRESRLIEILQKMAQSKVGRWLAFKGGSALRLFWNLPRFSQDLDFNLLSRGEPQEVLGLLKSLSRDYEMTDLHRKRNTLIGEYRFQWEGPNYRIKVEVALKAFEVPVETKLLRGIPILLVREDFLTAGKFHALLSRDAPRDVFDYWFILEKNLSYNREFLIQEFGSLERFFERSRERVVSMDKRKLLTDVGKLVDEPTRAWFKTSFREDLLNLIQKQQR